MPTLPRPATRQISRSSSRQAVRLRSSPPTARSCGGSSGWSWRSRSWQSSQRLHRRHRLGGIAVRDHRGRGDRDRAGVRAQVRGVRFVGCAGGRRLAHTRASGLVLAGRRRRDASPGAAARRVRRRWFSPRSCVGRDPARGHAGVDGDERASGGRGRSLPGRGRARRPARHLRERRRSRGSRVGTCRRSTARPWSCGTARGVDVGERARPRRRCWPGTGTGCC